MSEKKETKRSKQKLYSYDEYRKAFGVRRDPSERDEQLSPKVFGLRVAEATLKRVQQDLDRQQ